MVESPDESFYRDRYLDWIGSELSDRETDLAGSWLDAGCGSGRLTVPLAERLTPHGGSVVGVDFLGASIERARRQADAAGLENVELHEGELLEWLKSREDGEFAGAVFLEVGFVLPELEAVLDELRRVLRPGAPLLASFRALHYMVLSAVARREWDTADTILSTRSGVLAGMGWQNWETAEDVLGLLDRHGFTEARISGVGVASGIEGDPLSTIARPSELGDQELARLAAVESALARLYPAAGRYVLASAARR